MISELSYDKAISKGSYKVLPKAVFRISNDLKFFKNITTNELDKEKNALIDKFGKLIVLIDQKIVDESIYIVLEKEFEERFLKHIDPYILLSDAIIEKQKLYAVHIINKDINGMTIKQRIGCLLLTKNLDFDGMNEIPDDVYEVIRIENNISVQGIDFDNNMLLENNWDEAVSYAKGCYLGQEIMARVHNLGKPARKLVRILYDKIPEKVTSQGKDIGRITSSCFSPKYKKYLAFALISNYDNNIDEGEILKD